MFKSYYVVWKLSSAIQSLGATEKFKSYYVVWKLRKATAKKIAQKSLNRTM